mmetsp:Transcript_64736/g.76653  ORF Transcript_64736/g.76653 Transcript_64736/m.76653 type:complete len:227 (+) Transcript_64736:820-1500(+)
MEPIQPQTVPTTQPPEQELKQKRKRIPQRNARRLPNTKNAYHNLCEGNTTPPLNTDKLLELGLKFCIHKAHPPKSDYEKTKTRFIKNVRTKAWLKGKSKPTNRLNECEPPNKPEPTAHTTAEENDEQDDFNPRLYIPNLDYTPDPAIDKIEQALHNFIHALTTGKNNHPVKRNTNLTTDQQKTLKELTDNLNFIIFPTDKNLGPCVIECTTSEEPKRNTKEHRNST